MNDVSILLVTSTSSSQTVRSLLRNILMTSKELSRWKRAKRRSHQCNPITQSMTKGMGTFMMNIVG